MRVKVVDAHYRATTNFWEGFKEGVIPDKLCHVYALMCTGPNGTGLIKIGMTTDIVGRIESLTSTNGDIKAKYVAFVTIFDSKNYARLLERDLLSSLRSRRLGETEWHLFDFDSSSDKELFNAGCREVFSRYSEFDLKWAKYTMRQWKELGLKPKRKLRRGG